MSVHVWTTEFVYLVITEFATPELEDEWSDWYQRVHVPEMLTIDGVRGCVRYREVGEASRYVAIYEIDGPEVFEHERYAQVTGWGDYHPHVREWTRTITRVELGPQVFAGGAA